MHNDKRILFEVTTHSFIDIDDTRNIQSKSKQKKNIIPGKQSQ